jgi:hypothetical protein
LYLLLLLADVTILDNLVGLMILSLLNLCLLVEFPHLLFSAIKLIEKPKAVFLNGVPLTWRKLWVNRIPLIISHFPLIGSSNELWHIGHFDLASSLDFNINGHTGSFGLLSDL